MSGEDLHVTPRLGNPFEFSRCCWDTPLHLMFVSSWPIIMTPVRDYFEGVEEFQSEFRRQPDEHLSPGFARQLRTLQP